MKKIYVFIGIFIVIAAFFSGCSASADKKAVSAAALSASIVPSKVSRKQVDHQVLILVGPEYTARTSILAPIFEEFGVADSGGMVIQMQYPESFIIDKKIRLSVFSETAKEPTVTVVVTVGAPEGIVRELMKIRAARPEMQIMSLFSADEVLPVEAVSNLVLDYAQAGELLAAENTAVLSDTDLTVLILAAVLSGEESDSSIAPLDRLVVSLDASRRILKLKTAGAGWKIVPYVDPETNLRSRNHLVLQVPTGGI